MHKQFSETDAYSARLQEAMRYNKLPSSGYSLVMTILNAVSWGYTEKRWREEQERMLKALINQPPDKNTSHVDAANRYEQLVSCLGDLALWPW